MHYYKQQRSRSRNRVNYRMKQDAISIFKGLRGNLTAQQISNRLGVSVRKVYNLRQQYDLTGEIKLTLKNRHSRDFLQKNQTLQILVQQIVLQNPYLALQQICQILKQKQIIVSPATIYSRLQKLGFRYNRYNRIYSLIQIRNSIQLINQREQYASIMNNEDDFNLYFTHQIGFDLHPSTNLGAWFRPGTIIKPEMIAQRQALVTVYATLGIMGLVNWNIIQNSTNSEDFIQHIQNGYSQILTEDRSEILILQNSLIHQSAQVLQYFKNNNINFRYLPAFSSILSPIQNFFHKFKSKVHTEMIKRRIKSIQQLVDIIHQVIESFNEKKQGFQEQYGFMRNNLQRSRNRQVI